MAFQTQDFVFNPIGDAGKILAMAQERVMGLMLKSAQWLNINQYAGAKPIRQAYPDMLDGKMAAEDAVIFLVKGGF